MGCRKGGLEERTTVHDGKSNLSYKKIRKSFP